MTFEEALKRLEEIVTKLEAGDVSLDESLKLYEEGQGLLKFCQERLQKAETRVKELVKTGEGEFRLEPIEEIKDDS
jgi:exodeoxyribonuclease VII small subunit